jgi:hypothetical protein
MQTQFEYYNRLIGSLSEHAQYAAHHEDWSDFHYTMHELEAALEAREDYWRFYLKDYSR